MARKRPEEEARVVEEVMADTEGRDITSEISEEEIAGGDASEVRSRLAARAEQLSADTKGNKEGQSSQYVQLRFSRKFLMSAAVMVILLGFGVIAWQQQWYERVLAVYNRASVTLRVREGETIVLAGAGVSLDGKNYISDDAGSVVIPEITAGSYQVIASREGYDTLSTELSLTRGDNGAKILSLTKKPIPLYTLSLVINDAISGQPMAGVQVSSTSRSITTGESGEVSFDKLPAGKYQVTLSKSGYRDNQQEITLAADSTPQAISLVPAGQVVFTSKRTGLRAIYTANLDGSNQQQVAAASGSKNSEDYAPRLSPDGEYIAFASTREGVVSKYGGTLARMYISDMNGRGLKAIGTGYYASGPWWSPDGSLVAFTYYIDSNVDQVRVMLYNPAKDLIFYPGDTVNAYSGYIFKGTGGRDGIPFLFLGDNSILVQESRAVDGQSQTAPALVVQNTSTGDRRTIYEGSAGEYLSGIELSADRTKVTLKSAPADPNLEANYYSVTIKDGSKSNIAAITFGPSDSRGYVVSADAKLRIFVEERDGKSDVFLLDTSGKETRLSTLGAVALFPSPSFDSTGNYAIFTVVRSGEQAFYIVSLNGGDPKKLVDITLDN